MIHPRAIYALGKMAALMDYLACGWLQTNPDNRTVLDLAAELLSIAVQVLALVEKCILHDNALKEQLIKEHEEGTGGDTPNVG